MLPGAGGDILPVPPAAERKKTASRLAERITGTVIFRGGPPVVGALGGAQRGQRSPSVREGVWDTVGWPWEEQEPAPGAARAPPQEVLSPEVPRDRGPGFPVCFTTHGQLVIADIRSNLSHFE